MQRVNEFELPFRRGTSGVKYLMRGPRIDWGVIVLQPGERLGAHYHNEVEETFYVLRGRPRIRAGDTVHQAFVGDVFRMEPREAHDVLNDAEEEAKLVFIKAPFLPDDKVDV
jgi:quercetin dioxygenase-like cupin family protein